MLAFIVIPVFYMCSWFLKRSIHEKNEVIDKYVTSDDDYNIMVSNIPIIQMINTNPIELKKQLAEFFTQIVREGREEFFEEE